MFRLVIVLGVIIGVFYYVNPIQTKAIYRSTKSIVRDSITVASTVTSAISDTLKETTNDVK